VKRQSSAFVVLAVTVVLAGCSARNAPTGTIEKKYYAVGPWAVTVSPGAACCDSLHNKFDLYYPTNLGANQFLHPILTWGNGSFGKSSDCAYLLTHLASWGFVVIATTDQFTGPGRTILDAANYLVRANSDSASMFFHKLKVDQIGAIGTSQGAGGAINALVKSGGSIKTVIPIELPAHVWCTQGPSCPDTMNVTAGSIFFIDGSADLLISPPTQSPQTLGEESIAAYYKAVPAGVNKLKGTLIGPNHNDVTGQPDCQAAKPPCVNGVYGYLGYPTAWFMDRLQGDAYAHGAFVSGTGEIFSQTTNWELVASNIP
jgi:pimeloyl-ACP methyl ester carboxylesterase